MKKWQNMSNVNNINASLLSQIAQINVKTVLTLWFSFNQEDMLHETRSTYAKLFELQSQVFNIVSILCLIDQLLNYQGLVEIKCD